MRVKFARIFPRLAVALRVGGFLLLISDLCPLTSCSEAALPNDCVIVAVEKEAALQAEARLRKADVWTRVLIVYFDGKNMGHAFCVFSPHGKAICVYDKVFIDATLTLTSTQSREPGAIAHALGVRLGLPIVSGYFIE
jgi:hypothetical protein